MNASRSASERRPPAARLAVLALVCGLLAACGTGSGASATTPLPTRTPSVPSSTAAPSPSPASPSLSPTSPPSPSPLLTASPPPSGAGRFHVELANEIGKLVTLAVNDESGRLIGATSGTPGNGSSVPMNSIHVENDDPSTLRLTWAGPPCADADLLVIDGTGRSMIMVQPECAGDAIAFDRVVILEFASPVRATDVSASVQTAVDTSVGASAAAQ
jgi:hypothetical protein